MVVEKDKTSAAKNVFAGLGEVPSSRGVACRDQRLSTNGGFDESDGLIIQLIAGALGGNAAGSVSKDGTLGPMGNSIAGAIGGGLGGQVLSALLGLGGTAAASGMDVGSIVSAFLTGGVSGGLTALVVGFLKAKLAS